MKILIVGSGGREHAIASQLAKSTHQPELYFAPGNPGMSALGQRLDIEVNDVEGLLLFAKREQIDLTVVGPELPLTLGIVDRFEANGLTIFGPNQKAAQLESSKHFSKQLMQHHGIPTARYQFCTTAEQAQEVILSFEPPYVIKEDGLAAGKGVTIAHSIEEAEYAIERAFAKEMPVVIESFLQGQELSILAICDGQRALPLISAQDFKRIFDGNQGPNTGGMGSYAPVPLATPEVLKLAQTQVLNPMMEALQAEGIEYKGILYAGLMIDALGKPSVVEFNVRFGDPETQVVLPLLETDLVDLMLASAEGDLSRYENKIAFMANQVAVSVVMTSEGYPDDYAIGKPIQFPSSLNPNVQIFHAGTKLMPNQQIVTAGGRVLNVTAIAPDYQTARTSLYETIQQIDFDGKFFRKDIAEHPATLLASATQKTLYANT